MLDPVGAHKLQALLIRAFRVCCCLLPRTQKCREVEPCPRQIAAALDCLRLLLKQFFAGRYRLPKHCLRLRPSPQILQQHPEVVRDSRHELERIRRRAGLSRQRLEQSKRLPKSSLSRISPPEVPENAAPDVVGVSKLMAVHGLVRKS
jgi:hypothetical protein